MTTGQRIKAARIDAGLTQSALADMLDIPYQSIGQWERDLRNPKKETLQRIAFALKVPLRSLLGDDFHDHPASPYLSSGVVSSILSRGYTIDLQFDPANMDFYDLIQGAEPPRELYRITDTQTHRSVLFTGGELRSFASDQDKLIAVISEKVNSSPVETFASETELKVYVGALRTRPECRTLLSLAAESTKTEVEAAIAMLQALRGRTST